MVVQLFEWPTATLEVYAGRNQPPLPDFTPSEQAVYLRLWRLTHAEQTLLRHPQRRPRSAHGSLSTLKHGLKKLAHYGLAQVEWQSKCASLFTIFMHPLA